MVLPELSIQRGLRGLRWTVSIPMIVSERCIEFYQFLILVFRFLYELEMHCDRLYFQ